MIIFSDVFGVRVIKSGFIMRIKRFLVAPIVAVILSLQACGSLLDYLSGYVGSLWSPTVGDMIYLESAGDPFMFGKQYTTVYIQETLSYNILVSQHEVTNAAFREFIDDGGYTTQTYWTTRGWNFISTNGLTEPLYWNDPDYNAPNQPVVGVSWYEAVAFTQWLTIKEGFLPAYNWDGRLTDLYYDGYRLPTEVEWEYAASKGGPSESERDYPWGNSWHCGKAVNRVGACANYVFGPQAVASRSPDGDTPQALADMSGNVAEMVSDSFQQDSDISTVIVNNRYYYDAQATEGFTLTRGGAWSGTIGLLFQTSYRGGPVSHTSRSNTTGFRVVRTYPNQERPPWY